MQKISEITHWINISVDLGPQFFSQKFSIDTAVMILRSAKHYSWHQRQASDLTILHGWRRQIKKRKKHSRWTTSNSTLQSSFVLRKTYPFRTPTTRHFMGCVKDAFRNILFHEIGEHTWKDNASVYHQNLFTDIIRDFFQIYI